VGTSYYLFRLKKPLGDRPELDLDKDTVPFGSRKAIIGELASMDGAYLSGDEVHLEVAGADIAYSIDDDARAIGVDHAGPWDLLPVVQKLSGLGPMAIFDPQTSTWRVPEAYAAKPPARCPPFFGTPLPSRARTPMGQRWSVRHEARFGKADQVVVHRGVVVVPGWATVTALDARTGKTRWTLALGRGKVHVALAGGVLVCGSRQPELTGLDPMSGRTLWATQLDASIARPALPLGSRRLIAGTINCGVLLLDPRDGKVLWQRQLESPREGPFQIFSLAADERYIVVGTNVGACFCLSTRDGRVMGSSPPYSDRADDGDRWIAAYVSGLAIAGNQVITRDIYSIARLGLPRLNERGRIRPGLVRSGKPTLAISGGLLLEGAALVAPMVDLDRFVVHQPCAVRAWALPKLTPAVALRSPFGAPAPLPFAAGTWATLLEAGDPGAVTVLVALVDRRGKVLVEQPLPVGTRSQDFAVAANEGLLFVAAGPTLTAFRPPTAATPRPRRARPS
jgi:hypothetical protein